MSTIAHAYMKKERNYAIRTKGQLISEQNAVLNFPKMQQNIARISVKKVTQKAHCHPN